jgi:hypothetical protein
VYISLFRHFWHKVEAVAFDGPPMVGPLPYRFMTRGAYVLSQMCDAVFGDEVRRCRRVRETDIKNVSRSPTRRALSSLAELKTQFAGLEPGLQLQGCDAKDEQCSLDEQQPF